MEIMSETAENATQGAPEGETVLQPATTEVPTGTEQASPETVETPEPEPKRTPWFQKRIDDLTREKHEARRQTEAYASALREIQQRQAQGQPQQGQPQQPPQGYIPAAEVERLVEQRHSAEAFNSKCNDIADYGAETHADFSDAVKTFGMLGGTPPAFLEAVAELGKVDGARVYYELGKNPDEAAKILNLPPVKMALAVAKLAAAPAKAVAVSRVPAPIAPISGSTRVEGDRSKMSTEDYARVRRKELFR